MKNCFRIDPHAFLGGSYLIVTLLPLFHSHFSNSGLPIPFSVSAFCSVRSVHIPRQSETDLPIFWSDRHPILQPLISFPSLPNSPPLAPSLWPHCPLNPQHQSGGRPSAHSLLASAVSGHPPDKNPLATNPPRVKRSSPFSIRHRFTTP
jgi:hypothetical protein